MENLPNHIQSLILEDAEQYKRDEAVRERHTRIVRDNLIQDQQRHMDAFMNEYQAAQMGFEPDMRTIHQERIAVERLAHRIDQVNDLVGNVSPEEYTNDAEKMANMNILLKAQEDLISMRQRLAQRQQREMHEFLKYGTII